MLDVTSINIKKGLRTDLQMKGTKEYKFLCVLQFIEFILNGN